MTAETDLLPLPSVLLNWPHPTNHAAIRDYARANIAHATAAKDAEIEALRAERDLFRDETIELVRQNGEWQARAERLAEALRLIAAPKRPDGTWNRDREACRQIAAEAIAAALEQEAGRHTSLGERLRALRQQAIDGGMELQSEADIVKRLEQENGDA